LFPYTTLFRSPEIVNRHGYLRKTMATFRSRQTFNRVIGRKVSLKSHQRGVHPIPDGLQGLNHVPSGAEGYMAGKSEIHVHFWIRSGDPNGESKQFCAEIQ